MWWVIFHSQILSLVFADRAQSSQRYRPRQLESFSCRWSVNYFLIVLHFVWNLNFISYLSLIYVDVLSNRKLLCRLLQHKGISTDEAKDGKEALTVVSSCPLSTYNFIFMDNTMPVMVSCNTSSSCSLFVSYHLLFFSF